MIAEKALNKYTRIVSKWDTWLLRGSLNDFSIYIFEKNEEPVGYISFKFTKKKEWEVEMEIMDIAYVDIVTKKSIFAFLRNFDSDIRKIILPLPVQEEVTSYLSVLKTEHKFQTWPAMFRILNVKKALEGVNYDPCLEKELFLKVEDKQIEENAMLWKLEIKDGSCNVNQIDENELSENEVLHLTINQLTQLVIGYADIKSIIESTDIVVPSEWSDPALFPPRPCSIAVWF
ncbi:MAG: sterol carrier protein domain-containing protein [Candidatus Heimdallarchaeaceae archaeon]